MNTQTLTGSTIIAATLTSLALTASSTNAAIDPIFELDAGADRESDGTFVFDTVPSNASTDLANGLNFTVLAGSAHDVSGTIDHLTDGPGQTNFDSCCGPDSESFFANEDNFRIQVDLGTSIALGEINTYSWHRNSRAPQIFNVYGAASPSNSAPNFEVADFQDDAALATLGYTLIASVNTMSVGGAGGQVGVSIAGEIGSYRYILFDMAPTSFGVGPRATFYGEIDIIAAPGLGSFPIEITKNAQGFELVWASQPGMLYNIRSSSELSGELSTWTLVEGGIPATPDMNTKTITRPGTPALFYRVEEYPKPPVTIYSENFDGSPNLPVGWTTGPNAGDSGSTQWQLGNPAGGPGPSAANSASNCVGTNLTAKYGITSDVWLRSPGTIDLTGATNAKLLFQQWVDMDDFDLGDTGMVRVLDAAGLPGTVTELAVVKTNIQGLGPAGWAQFSANLPATALGKTVALEFRFASDAVAVADASGWYIDDVAVTVQTP